VTTDAPFTLNVACPTITVNPASLPNATINTAYPTMLGATPAGGSYSFAVTSGLLPAGLTLNSNGSFSGAPTQSGVFNFRVTASFGTCKGSRTYTGAIAGGACPTITLPALPDGAPGQLYTNSVTATPSGSYSYAMASGSLPPGLTLYGSMGLLYGYPMAAGTFNFTVTATDSNNCTGSKSYAVNVGGAAMASLVFGDFDGDGKADLSVWRGSDTNWYIRRSSDGAVQTISWGTATLKDVPVPGDYDGDGKTDVAIWRESEGSWYVRLSRDASVMTKVHGQPGDSPAQAKPRQ
jgi:hypothetical protein